MDTLIQVDGDQEECVALTARLGMALSALNTVLLLENCLAQCGRFCGHKKSLQQSSLEELESLLHM
jgi:hypothetical protein